MYEFISLDTPDKALVERFQQYTQQHVGKFALDQYSVAIYPGEPFITLTEDIETVDGPIVFITDYIFQDGAIIKNLDSLTVQEIATAKATERVALNTDDTVQAISFIALNGTEALWERLRGALDDSETTTVSIPASALEIQELLDKLDSLPSPHGEQPA